MAHLTLNCPKCRKQLVHVPLDGLTLQLRCEEHGDLIFTPLVPITNDDHFESLRPCPVPHFHTHDAA